MKQFILQLKDELQLKDRIIDVINTSLQKINSTWGLIDDTSSVNQLKVLNIFRKYSISDFHLNGSTGYGYGDTGRDILENVWSEIFGCESSLVRGQIVSGTHAIAICLFGNLKYGDELISVSGTPYDTLQKVIGKKGLNGTLIENGITYKCIPLTPEGDFDYAEIAKNITKKTKMVHIQRSRGYSWQPSLNISAIKKVIEFVKSIDCKIICFVDNCYGEFVELMEPGDADADIIAGSLIKNPGGGIAPRGGYITGKEEYVYNAACRLTAPGIAREVGSSLDFNRSAFQGLYLAPQITAQALKGAVFAAEFMEELGYCVSPRSSEYRTDIVQAIKLGTPEKMQIFCESIQKMSPIDSHVVPLASLLPGYDYPVIMAAGTFVQGSSIELSADGPIRDPYVVYLQGGLNVAQIISAVTLAANNLFQEEVK